MIQLAAFLNNHFKSNMKNIFFVFILMAMFSCSNNSGSSEGTDSMNRIDDRPIPDTQVAPFPDGYAPPNADMDTSQEKKDSLENLKQ